MYCCCFMKLNTMNHKGSLPTVYIRSRAHAAPCALRGPGDLGEHIGTSRTSPCGCLDARAYPKYSRDLLLTSLIGERPLYGSLAYRGS
jgi:hypothetical protein